MSLQAWLAFCATETVLCLIPGPAVLYVVSAALARGVRPGMAAAFGILAANTFYFVLSGTGIAAVILASSRLFTMLEWAGAAYLVWLGLRMLVRPVQVVAEASRPAIERSFIRGVLVQGANPKALVFFVALLPQFVDPRAPIGRQLLILGTSSVVIELVVLALYVAAAVRARELAGSRVATALERIGGGFLVAAGVRLVVVR
jgi:threonine/homoserine/homoserine lactone efflux protein